MNPPRTAVVTLAHGRHEHLAAQHRALCREDAAFDYVVVALDDPWIESWRPEGPVAAHVVPLAADPAGLPLARARNLGARTALDRGADVVVFLDVDCLPGAGLVRAYSDAVGEAPDVLWSGPVTYLTSQDMGPGLLDRLPTLDHPHPARPAPAPGVRRTGADPSLFWSLSFALDAEAWQRVGGFCEEYVGYGGEDTDFGRLVVESGLELGWDGSARAYHQYHPVESPPVSHLDDILRNGATFARRWGVWPMQGWLEQFERDGLVVRHQDGWVRAGTPG